MIPLDGTWKIALDPEDVGRKERWYAAGLPADAREARVPGVIQEAFPGCHGVAWYSREWKAPRHPLPAGRFLLSFQAVDYLAEVWVNGKSVGTHEGGESPFVLDATSAVRPVRPPKASSRHKASTRGRS